MPSPPGDGAGASLVGVSHINMLVNDLERSVAFYRDIVGLRVSRRTEEGPDAPGPNRHRKLAYLRWEDAPGAAFILLCQFDAPLLEHASTEDRVGIDHISLHVPDVALVLERAEGAGTSVVHGIVRVPALAYGHLGDGEILTAKLRDPDGTDVQLDQWVLG